MEHRARGVDNALTKDGHALVWRRQANELRKPIHPRNQPIDTSTQTFSPNVGLESVERAPNRQRQLFVMKRLGEVVTRTQSQRLEHDFLIGRSRKHDDRELWSHFPNRGENLNPIHIG